MNIEQANRIPLARILEKLTVCPGKPSGHERIYLSPLREERTPSFCVNPDKNLWYDHGTGVGGDVVSLVRCHLERSGTGHTVPDALRWLRNMTGTAAHIAPVRSERPVSQEKKLSLVKTQALSHPALVDYLNSRCIPVATARHYLTEATLYNHESKKHFFALAFQNESGGHELRNRFLKISIGKKDLSFIRGTIAKPQGIHLFEGMMDFLSALAHYKVERLKEDAIVFNSLSMMGEATPLIHGYGYREAFTWMDNDKAGSKATTALAEFLASEEGLSHRRMNPLYHPHKDVNEWRTAIAKPPAL